MLDELGMIDKYGLILANVPSESVFRTEFGEIRNLGELRNALVERGETFFNSYVNSSENHFANWVESVVNDKSLADSMRSNSVYGETLKRIDNRIKYAELWMKFNGDKEKVARYMSDYHGKFVAGANYSPEMKFETLNDFNTVTFGEILAEKVNSEEEQYQDEVVDESEISANSDEVDVDAVPIYDSEKYNNFSYNSKVGDLSMENFEEHVHEHDGHHKRTLTGLISFFRRFRD